MKRYVFFICLLLATATTKSQISVMEDIAESVILSDNVESTELGLSFMTMNANNSLAYSSTLNNRWWQIGLSADVYLFSTERFSFFSSVGFGFGWSADDDNTLIDLTAALNCGYNVDYENIRLMPHVGIGIMDNVIFVDNNRSSYDGMRLNQFSGYVPVGIKIAWKRLFADCTYRIRFLRSSLHEDDEDLYGEVYFKSTTEYTDGFKAFTLVFTLGVRF